MNLPTLTVSSNTKTSALLIGTFGGLETYLKSLLEENDVVVKLLSELNESILPESLSQDYLVSLDYVYVFSNMNRDQEARVLQDLLQSTSARVMLIEPFNIESPHNHSLEVGRTIRVGEFYGKGITAPSTISTLVTEGILHKKLTIFGDGLNQVRSLHADDLARGIILASISPYIDTNLITLVNPSSTSLLNLAYKIRALLPSKVEIVFSNEQTPAPPVNLETFSRTISSIGWEPEIQIEDRLEETISFLTQNVNLLDSTPPNKNIEMTAHTSLENNTPSNQASLERPKLTPLSTTYRPAPLEATKKKPALLTRLKPIRKTREKKQKPKPEIQFVRPKEKNRRRINFRISTPLIIIISLLGTYSFTILLSFVLFVHSIYSLSTISSPTTAPENKFERSIKSLSASYLKSNLSLVDLLSGKGSKRISDLSDIIDATELTRNSLPHIKILSTTTSEIANHFFGRESHILTEKFSLLRREIDTVYSNISLAYGLLPETSPSFLPDRFSENYDRVRVRVGDLNQALAKSKAIAPSLPTLLSADSSSTYLILLQNNMELRPTGGFIGSLALAQINNGTLIELEVYDVYSADGQLDGYVEPPAEIKEYLGENNWYLRDSNWDPDFPTTARRAEWFLSKTLAVEPSATIAINLFTIQDLLRTLGAVSLPDYQEEITADNLFERAEFHSEIDFFPGSTQKKEFLAALTDAIFLRLQESDESTLFGSLSALYNSLESQDTMISHLDPSAGSSLSKNNWSGQILEPSCPPDLGDCYQDSLMLNDANVGINKANYFVNRSVNLDISVLPTRELTHTLHITYENTATSHTWPAGNYKNYQRIYLPANIDDLTILVGGERLGSSDYSRDLSSSHTIIGHLLTVPINSSLELEITYTTTTKLETEDPTYHFFWQKQPGTHPHDISLTFNYPLYLSPISTSRGSSLGQGLINYTFTNSKDTHFYSIFSN